MAQENVTRFTELIQTDEALQAKLREAAAAYDGPKDDEKAVRFESLGRELSDAELDGVAGGSICIFIGFGDEPDADATDETNGGACAYVGVTLANWG